MNGIFICRLTLIKRIFHLSFVFRLACIHLLLGVLLLAAPVARVQEMPLDVKVCYPIYSLPPSEDITPYMPILWIRIRLPLINSAGTYFFATSQIDRIQSYFCFYFKSNLEDMDPGMLLPPHEYQLTRTV